MAPVGEGVREAVFVIKDKNSLECGAPTLP